MMDDFSWGRFLSVLTLVVWLGFLSYFAINLFTMHDRDDILSEIVQELNTQPTVSEDGTVEMVQDSDVIILEDNGRVVMFILDEKVFAADYSIENRTFSDNGITIKSIQQIKHEVNIGEGS